MKIPEDVSDAVNTLNIFQDVDKIIAAHCAQTIRAWMKEQSAMPRWEPLEETDILLSDGTMIEIDGSRLTIWPNTDPAIRILIDDFAICRLIAAETKVNDA